MVSTWTKILNWFLDNAPALIISIVSLIVAIKSWYKTRVFYDLEMYTIGGSAGGIANELDAVKKKLNTGKYTILNTFEETFEQRGVGRNVVRILIGKIKK